MKFKIGDKVRVRGDLSLDVMNGVVSDMLYYRNCVYTIADITADGVYCRLDGNEWAWTEEMLEPAYAIGGYASLHRIPTPSNPIPIEEQLGYTIRDSLDSAFDAWRKAGVSIHDLDPVAWYKPMEIKFDISDLDYKELNRRLDDYFKGLKRGVGMRAEITNCDEKAIFKEDKPMKFTFRTEEGTRIDKTCNGIIPTITTFVTVGRYQVGKATCDKADYSARQGCLEAIANAVLGGNFDKAYEKAVKKNKVNDKANRTCTYCGEVFSTVEERENHEAWHVECRKARHERYKLRKRAKEIAFEEAAQKLAKEMTGEK